MTFIIFGAAVMAIIFFGLGVVCKGLASAFNGGIETAAFIAKICLWSGIGIVALYLLCVIVNGIVSGNVLAVIGTIILSIVYIGIVVLFVGWLWKIIFMLVQLIVTFVMNLVYLILEFAAATCERAYAYFLNAIIQQLQKV